MWLAFVCCGSVAAVGLVVACCRSALSGLGSCLESRANALLVLLSVSVDMLLWRNSRRLLVKHGEAGEARSVEKKCYIVAPVCLAPV